MTIETLKRLLGNCTLLEDKVIVESNIAEVLEFVKSKYGFTVLKNISATKTDENIEIEYTIFSPDDNEECCLLTHVSDEMESICHIFKEAKDYEEKIKKELNVTFH